MDLVSNVVQSSLPMFISMLCSSIVVVRPVEVFLYFFSFCWVHVSFWFSKVVCHWMFSVVKMVVFMGCRMFALYFRSCCWVVAL